MKALNKNNAVESFHERDVDSEPLFEQKIDAAVSAEDHHHSHGTDSPQVQAEREAKAVRENLGEMAKEDS